MRTLQRSGFIPAVLAAVVALAGCAKRTPSAALDEAAVKAAHEKDPAALDAHTLALAGFQAYLIAGNPPLAAQRFDAAIAKAPSEPYALAGQMMIGRRESVPGKSLSAALTLLSRAPRHPLATMAARYLLESVGVSAAQDKRIEEASQNAISSGADGDLALLCRSIQAQVAGSQGREPDHARILLEMGVVQQAALVGPYSPWHRLAFDEPLPAEKDGGLPAKASGPFGTLEPRPLSFPDGRLTLSGEPSTGDIYLMVSDLEVPESADYLIRGLSSSTYKLYLDGALLFERRGFEAPQSTVAEEGVHLVKGRHRLLVKLLKEERTPTLGVTVARVDGKPSGVRSELPRPGAVRWGGLSRVRIPFSYPRAEALAFALQPDAGEALSHYLAAWDGMNRDRDGAKRQATLASDALSGPATAFLRAAVTLGDRSIPTRIAQGRATRDVDATLEKDKGHVEALLTRAALAMEDGRLTEAAEWIKQGRAAHEPVSAPLLLLQARVELALGIEAQAEQSLLAALKAEPGLCEALALRYDLARRRDAVALSDALLSELKGCPDPWIREAEHRRARGDLAEARTLWLKARERDPSRVDLALRLAELDAAQRQYGPAIGLLESMRKTWPRDVAILKRLGDLYESAAKPREALATREAALEVDGGDLTLRRSVWRAKTGRELLEEQAISTEAAFAGYRPQPGEEDSPYAHVLDAAATQVFPDGSMVDRVHLIQKALDGAGVAEIAEVEIPAGAQVLTLRTLKADGQKLEPEAIEGKDTISLPAVQVGDSVEIEYLLAHPARGPSQPGFTAASFYFQIARSPNHWSTYTVVAPEGTGMQIDAHGVAPAPIAHRNGQELFTQEAKQVPPFIPEPNGPATPAEFLPFVTVGAGERGIEGTLAEYADSTAEGGQRTFEVERFARAAGGALDGEAAVRAVFGAVTEKIAGRDAGLGVSASASLAQERGSRLWLLKASLEALGFPTRLVAVRTFAADPTPYRFPNPALYTYVCLRVSVGERMVWLDPLIRYAPFGELPETARGREAFLLPEPARAGQPARPLERTKTPEGHPVPPKQISLQLALSETGALSGSADEIYSGFEAAQLGEALESISPEQRSQALQGALAQYFNGANLSGLEVAWERKPGSPLRVHYRFSVDRFARQENGKWVLPPVTFPALLGRRYVQLSRRETPLVVDSTERIQTTATLSLPRGFKLSSPVPEIKVLSEFGGFVRREKELSVKNDKAAAGSSVSIEEDYRLGVARVEPSRYEAFADFAGEVDLAQSRDLVAERVASDTAH